MNFKRNFISCTLLFAFTEAIAQDTFSICAFDSATGQVGSAGATCITSSTISAIIISDVHPGVGVVHTQAYWLTANQNYAKTLMNLGLPPQQIIDSMIAHDAQSNPLIRQYGIVALANGGQSAAYTGVNCNNYKNHITGPNYSIQGNILLGQMILDSMETKFITTQGSLACKLMAALQGAKVPGADTRCLTYGISSYSAFIRVANPTDTAGNFYLDITVNTYPGNLDPIDSLQVMFNSWGGCGATYVQSPSKQKWTKVYPNPVSNQLRIEFENDAEQIIIYNAAGNAVKNISINEKQLLAVDTHHWNAGLYFVKIIFKNGEILSAKFMKE
ncbi:MAG: DUF1028 domain-containing protein [Bacteroidia bacterium]